MEESIGSVEDLATQNQIQYGLQAGGSTESFFRNSNYSTYQKMWSVMEKAEPSVFVRGNAEGKFSFIRPVTFSMSWTINKSNSTGVERVKRSGRMYAFFMESAPIKYITHRECNLTQVKPHFFSFIRTNDFKFYSNSKRLAVYWTRKNTPLGCLSVSYESFLIMLKN